MSNKNEKRTEKELKDGPVETIVWGELPNPQDEQRSYEIAREVYCSLIASAKYPDETTDYPRYARAAKEAAQVFMEAMK